MVDTAGGLTENIIALIEAAGGTRPESKSLQELYQALATALSSFLPGTPVLQVHAGTNVTVTGTTQNPIVNSSGGGGAVDSVVAGSNVTVDDTDPANPIVNALGVLESVIAGSNVTIDDTDPRNPIISSSGGGGGSFPNFTGSGSPEGVVTANVGQTYQDTATGTLYFKVSGTATDTGWAVGVGVAIDFEDATGLMYGFALQQSNNPWMVASGTGEAAITDAATQGPGGVGNGIFYLTNGGPDGAQEVSILLGPSSNRLWDLTPDGLTTIPGQIQIDTSVHGGQVTHYSAGNPNGSISPNKPGDVCWDTVNFALWISLAMMDTDWACVNLTLANVQTADYIPILSDVGKTIEMNSGSATTVTLDTGIFSPGQTFEVCQVGAGAVSFVAGSGFTIDSLSGDLTLAGQWATASVRFRSNTEAVLVGALT